MTPARMLAVAVFGFAVVLTAWAITLRTTPEPGALQAQPWLAYEVASGAEVDFVLPAETPRVRLVTRALHDAAWAEPGWEGVDYGIGVAWLDGQRQPVAERVFWERAGISRLPGPEPGPWRNAWLADDPRPVTDDRTTALAPMVARGGYLRVRAPQDGSTLLVRAYGEEVRAGMQARLALLGPSESLQAGLLARIGLPDWSLLRRGERKALSRSVWRSLRAGPAAEALDTRWLSRTDLRLSAAEQRLTGAVLEPGRSVAVNLVGPITMTVQAPADTDALEATLVGGELVQTAGSTLWGQGEARAFTLPAGPVSLRLHNPTDRPLGPLLMFVQDPEPDQLFGGTVGAGLTHLAPPGTLPDTPTVLIGPEWNQLTGYRVSAEADTVWHGAWPVDGDVLQLLVRPVLDGPHDRAPRVIEVEGIAAVHERMWHDAVAFVPEPAPYERLVDDTRWLGEPVEVYVPVDARLDRLVVQSRDELVVMMRARGAPQGDPDLYPLPEDGTLDVRYPRRPVSGWRALTPDRPDEDLTMRIAANTRLEPSGADDEARWYASVAPARRVASGVVWLSPVTGFDEGLMYCRYAPGTGTLPRDTRVVERLDGLLMGTLWTPRDALGGRYSVALDGETWQGGRAVQRVARFRTGRVPARSAVAFEGPPGSTLWLRTLARPGDCEAPHRPVTAWPVDPGERLTFAVRRTMDGQRFSIGGFGPAGSTLRVRVDDGANAPSIGLHPAWTDKDQVLQLVPGPGGVAHPVEDPDTALPVLQPRGFVLGSNLSGSRFAISVENIGPEQVWVRAALQTQGPTRPDWAADEPSRVRVGEAP